MKKIIFILVISLVGFIFLSSVVLYTVFANGKNVINDSIEEQVNIILPKSEEFKVTSTAKGDNQIKIARLNTDVFTYYLDNSNCFDPNARGNDKTMELIRIKPDGTYEVFDSIPVWMHGNVLTDESRNLVYYTTYEEVLISDIYYTSVKIYTYQVSDDTITLLNVHILADDQVVTEEANPRVGAHIDKYGNIAVAFGNYHGVLFVHVYDVMNDLWIKHSIIHYLDTYEWDSNLYHYVRLDGINHIRVVASRDTSISQEGNRYQNPARDYTRYFFYNGDEWNHFIISDLRSESGLEDDFSNATPSELFIHDTFDTEVIIKEDNHFVSYMVDTIGNSIRNDIIKITPEILVSFIRLAMVNNQKYYIVSGDGILGFQMSGYIEIYDYTTHKLMYRNNSVCKTPYVYINNQNDSEYLDILIISRDKNYQENSDTHYIRLKFNL